MFRHRLRVSCFALALVLAVPVPAAAEDIVEALALAYETNPTLRAARARLRATNERVPQELSNWRPQVTVDSSIGRQKIEDEDRFTVTDQFTTPKSGTLRVQQPIYRGGRTVAGVERAEREVRAERGRLAAAERDVLQRAVQAYLDVWRDREILRLNRENVASLREQLEGARQRFDRGVATRTDVAQAQTRLSRARARVEVTRGQLTASQAVYEEVIGKPAGDLSLPDPLAELPANQASAESLARADNPDVRAALFASRAADKQVRQTTGQLLPTLTLNGQLSREEETFRRSDETDRAQVQLNLQVPLYQAGQVTSQVRQAKQTASQRRLELAEARRRAVQQARSAWGDLESAREQIADRREQVEAAETALQGMEEELAVGSRTQIDVLDAEQDLFNAQISLVRAQRDLAVARFGVLAPIGRLTARDLNLDVPLYDPSRAYEAVRDLWFGMDAPEEDDGAEVNAQPPGVDADNGLGADGRREVESLLDQLDFNPGRVDGVLDDRARRAIGRFQDMAGLPVTNAADTRLLRELRAVAGAL